MLSEPQRSGYDLHFRLFGTDVRVHPFFWLFSAILGWPFLEAGFIYLALWIACSFGSILLHEFGHVWMGKLFGTDGYIVMYSFGGLAVGSNDLRERWQRILVSLAGPGIQFALYGLIVAAERTVLADRLIDMPIQARLAILILKDINLYWPLLNLLPVWPLDGGMVTRELCTAASRRVGLRASLVISGSVAALFAINSLYAHNHGGRGFLPYLPGGGMWTVILFASLAVESFQLLAVVRHQQQRPWDYDDHDDRLPWER